MVASPSRSACSRAAWATPVFWSRPSVAAWCSVSRATAPPTGPSLFLPLAGQAVPEDDVAGLDLADLVLDLAVEVEADNPGEFQGLVDGEPRSLEGVPGQDVPLGQRVEVVLPLDGGELLHPPPFDLAAGGVQCVFGPDGVGVELLVGEKHQLARFLDGPAPPQGPALAEDLQGRAEGGKIQVHAADSRLLKLAHPLADGVGDFGLDLLPVDLSAFSA